MSLQELDGLGIELVLTLLLKMTPGLNYRQFGVMYDYTLQSLRFYDFFFLHTGNVLL